MAERSRQEFRVRTASIAAPITTLSGGNQQKVVLARIVASGVRILVCDEPTAGVDVGARGELYALFRELTEHGSSFVMSSSDLQELLGLCDRILVMRQGKIVAEYGRDEVTEEQLAYTQLPQQEGGESRDNDERAPV
jgi:ABC-type sugar transport system ATPase subunit